MITVYEPDEDRWVNDFKTRKYLLYGVYLLFGRNA